MGGMFGDEESSDDDDENSSDDSDWSEGFTIFQYCINFKIRFLYFSYQLSKINLVKYFRDYKFKIF